MTEVLADFVRQELSDSGRLAGWSVTAEETEYGTEVILSHPASHGLMISCPDDLDEARSFCRAILDNNEELIRVQNAPQVVNASVLLELRAKEVALGWSRAETSAAAQRLYEEGLLTAEECEWFSSAP